jgi:hypothetical protein
MLIGPVKSSGVSMVQVVNVADAPESGCHHHCRCGVFALERLHVGDYGIEGDIRVGIENAALV